MVFSRGLQLCCWCGEHACCCGVALTALPSAPLVSYSATTAGPACLQWLCAPRGSAFLWVDPVHKAHVQPLIVSHGHGSGFTSEFIWDGGSYWFAFCG